MKKTIKILLVALVLTIFAIMAMGSGSSDEEESPKANNGGDVVVSEVSPGSTNGEAGWSVGEPKIVTWVNSIGSKYIQVIVPVTNTGTENLYLSSANIDLEDSEGHLVDTMSLVSAYPQVLKPGETGIYYEETILDEGITTELKALPHVDIEKAKVDCIRYEVSDISIVDEQYFGIKVMGRVENSSDEEESLYVSAILYGADGEIIGHVFTITDGIAAGDKIGFSASGFSLPGNITASVVDHVEVYAYPYQFQF